jgi:uncharacterized protein
LVNSRLPNREQAIQLLQENGCPDKVILHCQAVAKLALQIADELKAKGFKVDINLVEAGALLHDLGRSKTHTVDHAIIGVELAQKADLPIEVINIIKRHVGAGISPSEAEWLGWPKDNYVPETVEEKIVCYADKLMDGTKKTPITVELQRLSGDDRCDAAERVRRLHDEIVGMLGHQI